MPALEPCKCVKPDGTVRVQTSWLVLDGETIFGCRFCMGVAIPEWRLAQDKETE